MHKLESVPKNETLMIFSDFDIRTVCLIVYQPSLGFFNAKSTLLEEL